MLLVLDFRCSEEHVNEHFVHHATQHVECKECGARAYRVIPAPRTALDPISGDFPGATFKWERDHEKRGRDKKRNS